MSIRIWKRNMKDKIWYNIVRIPEIRREGEKLFLKKKWFILLPQEKRILRQKEE